MKVGKVRTVGSLEDVSFEMYVCNFVYGKHFLLVDLFEGEEVFMEIDQRYLSVRATSKIFNELKVFHGKILKRNWLL